MQHTFLESFLSGTDVFPATKSVSLLTSFRFKICVQIQTHNTDADLNIAAIRSYLIMKAVLPSRLHHSFLCVSLSAMMTVHSSTGGVLVFKAQTWRSRGITGSLPANTLWLQREGFLKSPCESGVHL